jgi:hypothetical protein
MDISYNAVHYIFLKASQYKYKNTSRCLPSAIRYYLQKFNNTDNLFLNDADTSATYNDLLSAYLEYAVDKYIRDWNNGLYKDRASAIKCICQSRSIDISLFKSTLLKRGIT